MADISLHKRCLLRLRSWNILDGCRFGDENGSTDGGSHLTSQYVSAVENKIESRHTQKNNAPPLTRDL